MKNVKHIGRIYTTSIVFFSHRSGSLYDNSFLVFTNNSIKSIAVGNNIYIALYKVTKCFSHT